MNFILHFLFVVLSYTTDPVFFSLHLLLFINISQTAKYVVKSITYRFPQLTMTFILAVFMIYAYSILQVDYFRHQFGADYPPTMCTTVYSCLLYSLNLGLRNGGGIGDSMDLMDLEDPKFGAKQIFDISYFMLINIVSLNIIFGIIIDTFAELRDAQNTRDDDLLNVCFICGHNRDVFEKEGISFDKHIQFEHNPIQYVNFLIYLRNKPSDEFDGTEEYVYTQYIKRKTTWVPIGQTNFIKVDIDEDGDAKLDKIGETVDTMVDEHEAVIGNIELMKKNLGNLTKRVQTIQKHNVIIKKRTRKLGDDSSKVVGGTLLGFGGAGLNNTAPLGGIFGPGGFKKSGTPKEISMNDDAEKGGARKMPGLGLRKR